MPERRTAAKLIRFHPEELGRITERARLCGQTSARFIRETALGAVPKARQHAATEAALSELARIGRRLDELTRLARAGEHAALVERLNALVVEHWTRVRQLVQDSQRGRAAAIAEPVSAPAPGERTMTEAEFIAQWRPGRRATNESPPRGDLRRSALPS